MPTDVIMPALELAQETGRIVRWLKAEGDTVVEGQPLLEIETDKVTVEVEAPASGRLASVSWGEGDDVPVGSTVAFILAEGEEEPAVVDLTVSGLSAPLASTSSDVATVPVDRAPVLSRRPLASPKARQIAAQFGADVAGIQGSGPGGAVLAADVLTRGAQSRDAIDREASTANSLWRLMAERTKTSWQGVPHFFLTREVNATQLTCWHASVRGGPGGERVTHTDLLVKLVALALAEHPRVNSSFQGEQIVESVSINIGIAVAVDDGLVVPVVHSADALEVSEIAQRRRQVVETARAGMLRPHDVAGGTFTISNLGMFAVDAFTAIINAPQAAILAVGRIADRVVAIDGRPEVRPTLALTMSFDHRVVDGARGAHFLQTLSSLVEKPPERLM